LSESFPPDAPPPAPQSDPSPAAPWGVRETLLGILGTALLWLGVAVGMGALALVIDQQSLLFRYSLLFAAEITLVVAPLAFAALTGAGAAALGLQRWSARAFVEGLFVGALLWGFTIAYEALLGWLAPEAAAQMHAEELKQIEVLAGPWPLMALAAVVLAPITEELFFRGFVFAGLRGRLGFAVASGLSAAFFAVSHFMGWSTIPLFMIGLGCATVYERRLTLAAPLAVHAAYNGVSLLAYALTNP